MATREEIALFREARAGEVTQQLALGKHYLFGDAGGKRNPLSALYWLHRAASRDQEEAWLLIGSHVPFEVVSRVPDPLRLCVWYERAADAGVAAAGLTWARLELEHRAGQPPARLSAKALTALERAAQAGLADAQWLLAQVLKQAGGTAPAAAAAQPAPAMDSAAPPGAVSPQALAWAAEAAANGVAPAQRALAERAWAQHDQAAFRQWALPLVRAIAVRYQARGAAARMPAADASLLARCADAGSIGGADDAAERRRFRELAAAAGDRHACFALGAWFANLDPRGCRVAGSGRKSNYAKAVQWLTLAAQQGLASAWYALYRIHARADQPAPPAAAKALDCLRRAAEAGHGAAQLELGKACWRAAQRHGGAGIDAAFWLQKAAAHGEPEAAALLAAIAPRALPQSWAPRARQRLTRDLVAAHPLLAARIELAALFGLTVPEALLLDFGAADRGHCLLVDIQSLHARSKPRLIRIETAQERLALDRIARAFAGIDGGRAGPEGNYRQRRYRFRKLFGYPERRPDAN